MREKKKKRKEKEEKSFVLGHLMYILIRLSSSPVSRSRILIADHEILFIRNKKLTEERKKPFRPELPVNLSIKST